MQKINFVDLPSRTTPINATNLNLVQTNTENAINSAKEEVLNVELIAVTDTAPATCSTGDKYYNTTTDLIYTATGTNTWGSTGESAVDGIMYIVYSKKSTYAYDGETLISVGGGSGAYIGTTEPPQDDNSNVWIDPNESVNVYGNYISNSYGTSQAIGYSQEYVNKNLIYSTNETDTGKKWIDGKPIYRKVTTVRRTAGSNTQYKVQFNIDTIDTITFFDTHVMSDDGTGYISYRVSDADQFRIFFSDYTTGTFYATAGTGNPTLPYNAVFIIEYTKTN